MTPGKCQTCEARSEDGGGLVRGFGEGARCEDEGVWRRWDGSGWGSVEVGGWSEATLTPLVGDYGVGMEDLAVRDGHRRVDPVGRFDPKG